MRQEGVLVQGLAHFRGLDEFIWVQGEGQPRQGG